MTDNQKFYAYSRKMGNAPKFKPPTKGSRIEQLERARKDLEKLSVKLLNEKLHGKWREPLENDLADAEAKLTKAVAGLKPLVQICEMMRDSSGFRKGRYQHEVTDSQWSAWCKQIKTARAVLAELEKQ